jgi:hypothetical protein
MENLSFTAATDRCFSFWFANEGELNRRHLIAHFKGWKMTAALLIMPTV